MAKHLLHIDIEYDYLFHFFFLSKSLKMYGFCVIPCIGLVMVLYLVVSLFSIASMYLGESKGGELLIITPVLYIGLLPTEAILWIPGIIALLFSTLFIILSILVFSNLTLNSGYTLLPFIWFSKTIA